MPESTAPPAVVLLPPPITLLRPTAVVSLLVSGLSVAFRSPTVAAGSLRVLPGLDRLPSRTRLSDFRSGELSLLVPGLAWGSALKEEMEEDVSVSPELLAAFIKPVNERLLFVQLPCQ
jgi:hypothetical protein